MKKTIKIKIGGIIFHIDDDAYEILKSYLDSLSSHFSRLEDGKEVMDDIETRIAEIFQQNTGSQKEVVNIDDVNSMITVMGEARDIFDEDEPEVIHSRSYAKSTGRLYRDPDNGILGGVCSGLGAYFNVDPLLFRILFLVSLLAYGLGLVYLILWIVLPKAVTPSQKLEMKGENINIRNIEKSVREEYEQVRHNLNSPRVSETFNNIGDVLLRFLKALGNIILIFLKIILIIIGGALILAGFVTLLSFLGVLIFGNSLFFQDITGTPGFYLPHILPIFTDTKFVPFVMIALILAVVIPLIALIYGGIKLIFRFKVKDKAVGIFALILWLIAIGGLITIGTFESLHYANSGNVTKTYKLKPVSGNTVIIKTGEMPENSDRSDFLNFEPENNEGIYRDAETGTIYGKAHCTIKESKSGELKLEIRKKSRGRTPGKAWEHALDLGYYWNQRDSLIVVDPYFELKEGKRWRNPGVKVTLLLPEGYKVYIDEGMTRVIDFIPNTNGSWGYNMVDKTWIMTEEGLEEWIPGKDSLQRTPEANVNDSTMIR